uniref:Uncharacterized protein n=1 Tax=Arundo donax TaxID=35708 RepID=A0A0A9AT52_ARUDO
MSNILLAMELPMLQSCPSVSTGETLVTTKHT